MINTRDNFMNKLWSSSGKRIKTSFGDGIITEMRATAGIDISVDVFYIVDSVEPLFSDENVTIIKVETL